MSKNITAESNFIPFKFDTREVRTLLIDDQPWFVASDVSSALQYRDAFNMNRNLDDDEKGTQIVSTPGGKQEMQVINESGLYSAILRSRKAEAKRFKKWVTAELLPAIRKHGRYEVAPIYMEQTAHQSLAIAQDVDVQRRPLRGRHVLIAHIDGQLWLSAGNLCAALDLGCSSDRITRSLSDQHKRKLQRGARELWMVDADGARRAADYCKSETATEYNMWLQRLLAEFAGGTERHLAWAGERDVLSDVPVEVEQLLGQKLRDTRFMVSFEFNGEMLIKAIDPDTTLLRRDRLATYIGDPEGAPRGTLPDILEAVGRRMKSLH